MEPHVLTGPIVRIITRYGSGALVAWGLVAPDRGPEILADADLQTVLTVGVGLVLGAVTEWWYGRAKRTGGPT